MDLNWKMYVMRKFIERIVKLSRDETTVQYYLPLVSVVEKMILFNKKSQSSNLIPYSTTTTATTTTTTI